MAIETKKIKEELKDLFKELNRNIDASIKLWIFQASALVEKRAKENVAETVNKNVKIRGLSRTGNLLNSIHSDIMKKGDGWRAVVGSGLKYARIQEYGGVIVPKKKKKLFIPISRKGQRIGPTRSKRKRKKNGLKWGQDFVLAKRAVRKAKPFLGPAVDDSINDMLHLLGDILERKL